MEVQVDPGDDGVRGIGEGGRGGLSSPRTIRLFPFFYDFIIDNPGVV